MFSHFGAHTSDDVVTRRPAVCDVCGVYAAQPVVKRSTTFTAFFVRPFPVKRSTYYAECENCGHARRIDH
ncbi:zinc-ribbon domain-containing protein [Actinoplanes sp. NPDC051633]|uniref:zinc-ribbon domain-containing protein n=1 Tax=Actinoplanes sp. NPDC051633 TaxID=3155670 RepID=UPI00342CEC20